MSEQAGLFAPLRTVLEMIKFEHTVFALPFALSGAILAAEGIPATWQIFWILIAMVGARSAAMAFNRLVDRHFDARNPRTADRALPAGKVSVSFVWLFVLASCALLVVAAWRLNELSLALSPVALAVILGYSFTKRFTSMAHIVLGVAVAGAPLGAWIAIRGDITAAPLVLAAAVAFWVAGFDVLYALQDREFDRGAGLSSIPTRFGVVGALWISGGLHLTMLVLLALLVAIYPPGLGWAYGVGWLGCLVLLVYQHAILRPSDLSRLDAAFFRANGALSVWLFAAIAIDIVLP